jgi:hypothetical protein
LKTFCASLRFLLLEFFFIYVSFSNISALLLVIILPQFSDQNKKNTKRTFLGINLQKLSIVPSRYIPSLIDNETHHNKLLYLFIFVIKVKFDFNNKAIIKKLSKNQLIFLYAFSSFMSMM